MSEWRYIVAAYVLTWVVLIGYAVRLRGVVRRAERASDASGTGNG